MQTMPTVIETFLSKYLPLWNGVSDVATMLDLLAYLPASSFPSKIGNALL